MIGKKYTGGFTLFFAMLTASLALAVGLAIYDLTVRQVDLATASTQSQYAIYAADLGAECALYWDYKAPSLNGTQSAFGTTTPGDGKWQASGVNCNAQDVTVQGPPAADLSRYPGCVSTAWCVTVPTPDTHKEATTTFTVTIPNDPVASTQTYCAVVQVGKYTNASGVLFTTVISRGYNTCTAGATRFERALQLSY